MLQIPMYLLVAPALVLTITLIFANKGVFYGPLIVFVIMSLPAFLLPLQNGYEFTFKVLMNWTILFSLLSLFITLVLRKSIAFNSYQNV